MTKKLIFYFHGYGSSSTSSKVDQLKTLPNTSVFAFDIDIDPRVSVIRLSEQIDNVLLDYPESNHKVVFVGTSLGAWYASQLGILYDVDTILINPSYSPARSLTKYGVDPNISNAYGDITPRLGKTTFFFADNDSVIPNKKYRNELLDQGYTINVVADADHRFNDHFGAVLKVLNEI